MICRKNVQRLTLRVEELVQLSRFERFTTLDAAREEVDLCRLIDGVIESFQPRLEEAQIGIAARFERDINPLQANPEQLERVFFNLLDNAVKFCSQGGSIVVTVEACTSEGDDGVLVRVQDNGVGIPSSELVRIFDRFHQVDPSSRRRYGGMGLGLSLVRSIIEAHRGTVWAESEQGVGTTIHVWLPCADPGRTPAAAARPSDRLGGTRVGRGSTEGD
jgi:signal transduction histidine kinase